MSIKRKNRAEKVYAYQMLLNTIFFFKKKKKNFKPNNCVCCELAFVGHNSIFCSALCGAFVKHLKTLPYFLKI